MKKILLTLTTAVLASVGFAQLSGTYTVNGGSATGGTNYNTFAAAFSALTSNGVNGAVTFNCIEGTYNGQVYLSNANISGTSTTNTVTFQADAGNTNEVLWQHSSYPLYMYNTNLNNVSFDGLHMKTTSTYSSVIYMYRGLHTNLTWENCTFTGANTTSTSQSYSVFYAFYTSPQNVTLSNNTFTGGSMSITFYRPDQYNYTNTCTVNIEDNDMTGFYYRGMYLYGHYYYHTEWHITGNSVTGGGYSYPYGMYVYYSDDGSDFSSNYISVSGASGGYGAYIYYSYGTSSAPVTVENNIFQVDAPNSPYTQYGMLCNYGQYTLIYHNTIRVTNSYTYSRAAYLYYTSSSYVGNEFKNNIVVSDQTGPYTVYAYLYPNTLDMDYNAYSVNGGSELYNYNGYTGTTAYALSTWQSGASQDPNSVADGPSFISSTNLTPQSANINNAGDALGVVDDILGQTRSTTTPDPGAIEFSVPTNNAQPGSLVTPDAPLCDNDTSLSIMLANPGLVALTSCSLHYSINAGTPVSTAWTGNIAPANDTLVIMESSISFTDGDELMVWTSMPNGVQDSSTLADTISLTLWEGMTGTYAIPADYATIADAKNALETKGVCDDVIFNIAAGTYNESVSFGDISGTSEAATVIFQSASGTWSSATIEYAGTFTIDFNGADWISFKNLKVTNTSGNVFKMTGSSDHVTIDGCWAQGANGTSTTNQSLFYMQGSGNDLTLSNNRLERGASWFYSTSGSTAAKKMNITIEDNHMKNQVYYGAMLYYFDGLELNRNTVTNDSAFQYGYGYYGLGLINYTDNFNITRNSLNSTVGSSGWRYGLVLQYSVGASNPRSQIANNCLNVGYEGNTSYSYYGLYLYQSGLIDVYNNTVNRWGSNSSYAIYMYQGGAMNLMNNSFANYSQGYAAYINGAFAINNSDHNNYYNTSGALAYFGSSVYNTLEDLQNGTGHELNSVVVDPDWEDVSTCTTCNDTLGNAGAVLSAITDDLSGNVRSVSNPDIGAVEYVTPATFTLGGDDTICGNEAIVEAGPAQSVTWNVNNQTSTQAFVTLTATTEPVTYNVSVNITTEFCGSGSDAAVIRLVPNATLDSSDHICADETLDLEPGGASGADYTWSTGATTATITVDEPGTYSVTKMEDGCESTSSIDITKSVAVEIVDLDACSDDLPLTIDATIANGTSYAWSGGSSINTAANDFSDAGSYSVTATDSYGCSSNDDFQLTILETPEAAITQTHSANAWFFDGTSSLYISSNTTYLWDFGYNGQTATTASATVVYPWSDPSNPTPYTVTLTIDNGCGTDVQTMEVTPDPLGIGAIAAGTFGMYPNPATDNVNFVLADAASAKGTVEVMDVTGRVLSSQIIAAGQSTGEVNVSDLAAGSYLVKISVDGVSSVNTLIKQ